MAKSSADDAELRRACEAAIEGTKQKIVISIRVVKTHGTWGKAAKLGRQMAKPRVLAISSMRHYSLILCIFHPMSRQNELKCCICEFRCASYGTC